MKLYDYNVFTQPIGADFQPSEVIFVGVFKAISMSWLAAELATRKLPKGRRFSAVSVK